MNGSPRVSVIVNTNGRAASLMNTLDALRRQTFGAFEVCVVCGPTRDGTRDVMGVRAQRREIKLAFCDELNLSVSRNMGVRLAAGELIAFIDDDALPEPSWLCELATVFGDPAVAGAGGLVFEPDGRSLQFRYSSCDRFGRSEHQLTAAADPLAYPYSPRFPHFMGTNCMFRREVVAALGGFDEAYDYYLEEADLCCRLVDAGHALRQVDGAPVHHLFLPGAVRDGAGITVNKRSILKSQLYFSLVNGRGHATLEDILKRSLDFVASHRRDLQAHASAGRVHASALTAFEADAEWALETALSSGLHGRRRLQPPAFFEGGEAFLPYPAQDLAPTPA